MDLYERTSYFLVSSRPLQPSWLCPIQALWSAVQEMQFRKIRIRDVVSRRSFKGRFFFISKSFFYLLSK